MPSTSMLAHSRDRRRVHRAYDGGNRLRLDERLVELGHRHFFYKVTAPKIARADMEDISSEAIKRYRALDCDPSYIEAYWSLDDRACAAIDRIKETLGLPGDQDHDVLVCQWAAPHEDQDFAGEVFLSVVLHTGPSPYSIQTFHTEVEVENGGKVFKLRTQRKTVHEGDVFLFDPTTPHMAAPVRSNDDAMLVMLQFRLRMKDAAAQAALLARFAPTKHTKED